MKPITEYLNTEVYPRLYKRIDVAFPELEFTPVKGDWHSSHYINGAPNGGRADKTVITKKHPNRALEQGGESLTLVGLRLRLNHQPEYATGAPFIQAVRELASVCGLVLPELDTEKYHEYQRKLTEREQLAADMQKALYSPEGADVLKYLKETRGYTDAFIKAAGLGYCSPASAKRMEGGLADFGTDYELAIPYYSGSSLLGFKLRTIRSLEHKPKYKNSAGLPKKASLFNLSALYYEERTDVTIVEGELDALRADFAGVHNVTAAAGFELSAEAVAEAARMGAKRITMLLDTEADAAKQETQRKQIEKAIRAINRAGLTALVAELPYTGEKVDVDSFLEEHGKEELESVINTAESGSAYLFRKIHERAAERQSGTESTDKSLDIFKREVYELYADPELTTPTERDTLLLQASAATKGVITKESFEEEAEYTRKAREEQRQTKSTKELLDKAQALHADGKTRETLELLKEAATKTLKENAEDKFSSMLSVKTATAIRSALKDKTPEIPTKYQLYKGGVARVFSLPTGAITLIGAPSTHGKSTFLRNLALDTMRQTADGVVLYYTYEESEEDTQQEFLNTFAELELTTEKGGFNNLSTIKYYYSNGESTRFIKQESLSDFKLKEKAFIEDCLAAGRLRIFETDFFSGELVESIEYLSKHLKVAAVFIDYVQLIHKEGSRVQRNEELALIAKDLRQTAKSLQLPIVLGAQLNREAYSPMEMHKENIADSAYLEREANQVLLLWNSEFEPLNGSKLLTDKTEYAKLPLTLGTSGQIYVKLAKCRGGEPNQTAVLEFNGNTGRIKPNLTFKKGEAAPGQTYLPF